MACPCGWPIASWAYSQPSLSIAHEPSRHLSATLAGRGFSEIWSAYFADWAVWGHQAYFEINFFTANTGLITRATTTMRGQVKRREPSKIPTACAHTSLEQARIASGAIALAVVDFFCLKHPSAAIAACQILAYLSSDHFFSSFSSVAATSLTLPTACEAD
jgi:hypothetical protein